MLVLYLLPFLVQSRFNSVQKHQLIYIIQEMRINIILVMETVPNEPCISTDNFSEY